MAAMRQVATHINEGKRRLENIGRIGKWQESIDGWKVHTCTCLGLDYLSFPTPCTVCVYMVLCLSVFIVVHVCMYV